MIKRIIAILCFALSFGSALAQSPLAGRWQGEHAECVENVARLWLNDPADSAVNLELARLVRLETYLKISRAPADYLLDRIDPSQALPPQIFLIYLRDRGLDLSPGRLFVGRSYLILKERKEW